MIVDCTRKTGDTCGCCGAVEVGGGITHHTHEYGHPRLHVRFMKGESTVSIWDFAALTGIVIAWFMLFLFGTRTRAHDPDIIGINEGLPDDKGGPLE